jgi:HK97 family phage major capsid protein
MKTLKTFLVEKGISDEAFNEMSAESKAELFNELNEVNAKAFKSLSEDVATSKEEIANAVKESKKIQDEQMKNLNAILEVQGLAIKKLTEAEKVDNNETFSSSLRKSLEANKEKLTSLKEGNKFEAEASEFEFELKAAGNMTIAGNVSGGNVPVEDRLSGFNVVPSRRVRLMDIMSQRSTASNVVSWVYQANKDGAAGQTAEGAAKNQIDFDIVVANESVKKTTAYIKVSTEMLDDVDWIQSEIENELMRELTKAVESQCYSGDGTGNNMNGIRTVATAFAAGTFALAIDNANEVDVLTVAANQIAVAQEGNAMANYILMHPTDVTALKLEKLSATDKRYVERLMIVGSTLLMDGIPIIPTTLVTVGEYLIGDFGLSILVTRQAMRFDIGLDADDWTKNLRTILGEFRGLTIVKNNDRTAFYRSWKRNKQKNRQLKKLMLRR